MPQLAISERQLRTVSLLNTRSPVIGQMPPLAKVAVAATGRAPLGRASEGRLALEVPVPATGAELLRALAAREPGLAELLLDGEGRPIPAVVREGRPLAAGERVEGGDRIELVWVVPGG